MSGPDLTGFEPVVHVIDMAGAAAWVRGMVEDGLVFTLQDGGDPGNPNAYSARRPDGRPDRSAELLEALARRRAR